MRFYSFVAGLYLSELQKGLQTGHAISEVLAVYDIDSPEFRVYHEWAKNHKTIIILNALNHGGVVSVYQRLKDLADILGLPVVQFNEDEVSMNAMATAAGIVLPAELYDVSQEYRQTVAVNLPHYLNPLNNVSRLNDDYIWVHTAIDGDKVVRVEHHPSSAEFELINLIKQYRLA